MQGNTAQQQKNLQHQQQSERLEQYTNVWRDVQKQEPDLKTLLEDKFEYKSFEMYKHKVMGEAIERLYKDEVQEVGSSTESI